MKKIRSLVLYSKRKVNWVANSKRKCVLVMNSKTLFVGFKLSSSEQYSPFSEILIFLDNFGGIKE
mgnify:CR=1 FL=1